MSFPRRAQILLSTHDGARFLEPLLDSLLAQDHPSFSILVRDDASTDATPAIVERYARDPRLSFYVSPSRLGAARSYFELLTRADTSASFFALADQDDVWLTDKLGRAVERLSDRPLDTPALYCGRQILVDAGSRRLGLSPLPRRGPSFNNAIVENIAAGCTVVVNGSARALLASRVPSGVRMHDRWAYLVVAALGWVVYDAEPKILYRLHPANAVGSEPGRLGRWLRRFERLSRRELGDTAMAQALELQRLFGGELDEGKARIVRRFVDHRRTWTTSLAYALRPDVVRQARLDDAALRLLLGVGWI